MKLKGILISAFVLIIAAAVGWDMFASSRKAQDLSMSTSQTPLDPGSWQPVPDVSLMTLDGRSVPLNSLKGKVVLLNFWATWCASCKVEMPSILKLVRSFKGQFVLVAVSADSNKADLENFLNELRGEFAGEIDGGNVIVAWDPKRSITGDVFQTERFPEAIILSKDLRMARKVVGSSDWTDPQIKEYIQRLLAL